MPITSQELGASTSTITAAATAAREIGSQIDQPNSNQNSLLRIGMSKQYTTCYC